jgi:hypothetical protein
MTSVSQDKILGVVDHTHKEVTKLVEVASKVQAQTGQATPGFFVNPEKQEKNRRNSLVLQEADEKIAQFETELKTSLSATEGLQSSSSSSPTR